MNRKIIPVSLDFSRRSVKTILLAPTGARRNAPITTVSTLISVRRRRNSSTRPSRTIEVSSTDFKHASRVYFGTINIIRWKKSKRDKNVCNVTFGRSLPRRKRERVSFFTPLIFARRGRNVRLRRERIFNSRRNFERNSFGLIRITD